MALLIKQLENAKLVWGFLSAKNFVQPCSIVSSTKKEKALALARKPPVQPEAIMLAREPLRNTGTSNNLHYIQSRGKSLGQSMSFGQIFHRHQEHGRRTTCAWKRQHNKTAHAWLVLFSGQKACLLSLFYRGNESARCTTQKSSESSTQRPRAVWDMRSTPCCPTLFEMVVTLPCKNTVLHCLTGCNFCKTCETLSHWFEHPATGVHRQ